MSPAPTSVTPLAVAISIAVVAFFVGVLGGVFFAGTFYELEPGTVDAASGDVR